MLTTGVLVYSSSPQTDSILEHARESLKRGAEFSEAALEQQRYGAACLYEDAFEVHLIATPDPVNNPAWEPLHASTDASSASMIRAVKLT